MVRRKDMLPRRRLFDGQTAYWWSGHLANTSEVVLATDSLPFRPLPVAVHTDQWIRLPAWGFLLVFFSSHSPEMR